ncbi:MAG: UPF0262 family protein [Rhodospirillales bacterium]|nr:UPF0262 family protein [Rhodospirillales bacterium]
MQVAERPAPQESTPSGEEERSDRIVRLLVEDQARIRLSPAVEHERRIALYDLLEENRFAVKGPFHGPYVVHLAGEGERLVFTICDEMDLQLTRFSLPLGSMRSIIKDYFLICESYFDAIKTMPPNRIEAIDMGRRGLHNDGAQLLRERLAEKVEIDKDTARRLFTLICVLHIRR